MKVGKIIVIAGTGIAFILCAAFFVIAYRSYAEASKVEATLDSTGRQLSAIYNKNPFPSPTNMAILRSDTAWLADWRKSLVDELREAVVSPEKDLTPSLFKQFLQNNKRELQHRAKAEGGNVLPNDFAFGFERYLSRIELPKIENVKRLEIQRNMITNIVCELLDCHVTSISQIERQRFEGEAAETAARPGVPRHGGGAQLAAAAATVVNGVADKHYTGEHFSIAFHADEKALARVLDRFAKMPLFVVVTELDVKREHRGLLPHVEKPPAVESEKAAQQVVSGPEIPQLLNAQMQIDVYTFEGV